MGKGPLLDQAIQIGGTLFPEEFNGIRTQAVTTDQDDMFRAGRGLGAGEAAPKDACRNGEYETLWMKHGCGGNSLLGAMILRGGR